MRVLGIETSCDETGVAIYDQHEGLLAHQLYSQSLLHADYGGVVPEIAARNHIKRVVPLILSVLKQAHLRSCDINGVAYTAGPGLAGSLLVGATIARTLAYAWKVPAIDVHHMEAHLLTPLLKLKQKNIVVGDNVSYINNNNIINYPFIALLVSGGHTQLVMVKKIGDYKILGESIDDSVGEVFDKVARSLGLPYPGGALLSVMARRGVVNRYIFPKPMINHPNLNFSFSGLKTAVIRTIMSSPVDDQTKADIACGFERAIVEILSAKCYQALKKMHIKHLVLSGGVSSNVILRSCLSDMLSSIEGRLFYPEKLEFCTDNGAMIAHAGLIRLKAGLFNSNLSILIKPRWSLESLPKII